MRTPASPRSAVIMAALFALAAALTAPFSADAADPAAPHPTIPNPTEQRR